MHDHAFPLVQPPGSRSEATQRGRADEAVAIVLKRCTAPTMARVASGSSAPCPRSSSAKRKLSGHAPIVPDGLGRNVTEGSPDLGQVLYRKMLIALGFPFVHHANREG